MKKLLALFIPSLISALIVLLSVEDVTDWLEKHGTSALTVGAFLAALTFISQLLTVYTPFKKYEQLEKNKWIFLTKIVHDFTKQYEPYGLMVNIMLVELGYFYWLEPGSRNRLKFTLYGKRFRIVWASHTGIIDKQLKFTTNQGLCGMAYNQGKLKAKNFNRRNGETYNLTEQQKKLTADVKLLISCPIFAPDETYTDQDSNKVVAVLNVESHSVNSRELLHTESVKNELFTRVLSLAKVCSKMV